MSACSTAVFTGKMKRYTLKTYFALRSISFQISKGLEHGWT